MSDDPYVYPGTTVLKNKLGIRDQVLLDYHERELVLQRIEQGAPKGNFDLAHIRSIHHHLFQDIYTWAGKPRTVEIAKNGNMFQFQRYIQTGMNDVHRRLENAAFLRGLTRAAFAKAAGPILGDVNYVHPFREGNGRTQLLYLEQLAAQAGHTLDLTRLTPQLWLDASRVAHDGQYDLMSAEISRAITV